MAVRTACGRDTGIDEFEEHDAGDQSGPPAPRGGEVASTQHDDETGGDIENRGHRDAVRIDWNRRDAST